MLATTPAVSSQAQHKRNAMRRTMGKRHFRRERSTTMHNGIHIKNEPKRKLANIKTPRKAMGRLTYGFSISP